MSNLFLSAYSANLKAQTMNGNSVLGGATLTVYSGTQPANANTALSGNTALAIFTLPVAGSNSVSGGVITVGTVTSVTASANGTATFFRVTNGGNTILDGSAGTSSADLILNATAISAGALVSILSFSYTEPQ